MTTDHRLHAFATTRWTLIRAAGSAEPAVIGDALETLCTAYWFPLYAYVRRQGHGREDAEDLTQAFFAKLLERQDIAGLRRENGRFRAFLLAAMKHFLANDRDRAGRLKRGGGAVLRSLDWEDADARFEIADASALQPDQAFDREWALELLERVLARLRGEWAAEGRAERFEEIKGFLTAGEGDEGYGAIAARTGLSEGALRVAAHRLRRRYRQMLREEIARTLSEDAMVEEEMRVLLGAFG